MQCCCVAAVDCVAEHAVRLYLWFDAQGQQVLDDSLHHMDDVCSMSVNAGLAQDQLNVVVLKQS